MKVEFTDLLTEYRALSPEMGRAVEQVMASGQYIQGPQVEELESRLAERVGVRHCVTVSSGTDALLLSLMCLGIGPGDGVITTAFSFFAAAEVISLLGATPVFCDCRLDTFNLDPTCLEQTIRRCSDKVRLRAVIPADLFGLCADYEAICAICDRHNLVLIEDGAQSFGASCRGKAACGFGQFGCTSFFPSKPLGCYGDGGAVFTDSDRDAELLRSLRAHGRGRHKYDNCRIGVNGRLDTLQAAVLLEKLRLFDEEIAARRRAAARYDELLEGLVRTPVIPADCESVYAQYTITLPDRTVRDGLREFLDGEGVPTRVYYPIPLHRQQVYRGMRGPQMPNAEELSGRVLSLPMHPWLTDEQIVWICGKLRAYLSPEEE